MTQAGINAEKKRKLEEDAREPSFLSELEDVLECPVCFSAILSAPIYACENLHHVCFKCHKEMTLQSQPCPICRGALTMKRNHLAEKIIEKLPKIDCRNKGCHYRSLHRDAAKIHEENDCPDRPVPCPSTECQVSLSLRGLRDHLVTTHKKVAKGNSAKVGVKADTKLCLPKCDYNLHEVDGVVFVSNWTNEADGSYIFWVSCIGPRDMADSYKYSLQVYRKTSEDRAFRQSDIQFAGVRRCVYPDISHTQMQTLKRGLIIDPQLLKSTAVVAGEEEPILCCSVKIMKA